VRVLVTGACGYIGSMLVPSLLADGHKVTAVDTEWFGEGHMPDNDNLRFKQYDLRDAFVVEDIRKSDVIIHLASISNNAMAELNPVLDHEINRKNVRELSKYCFDKRFIYASSVAAYGSNIAEATQATPLRPETLYGASKTYAEGVVRSLPNSMTVRLASVVGASMNMRFDTTINKMTHDAIRKGAIRVNGGQQKRCHVHIKDVLEFFTSMVDSKEVGIRNLVGTNMTVMESAEMISRETGANLELSESADNRSYAVAPQPEMRSIKSAVHDMKIRLETGYWKDSQTNPSYQRMNYGLI
jgi:nucleoside-diphosphate-sugar epimerase